MLPRSNSDNIHSLETQQEQRFKNLKTHDEKDTRIDEAQGDGSLYQLGKIELLEGIAQKTTACVKPEIEILAGRIYAAMLLSAGCPITLNEFKPLGELPKIRRALALMEKLGKIASYRSTQKFYYIPRNQHE